MATSPWSNMYASDLNNAWGTKRKYGERASSCASSAGSMDSRLSENFEGFDTYGNNRPSSPPSWQLHPFLDSSPPFTISRHKKLRRDSTEESDHGPSGYAGLPGPPNLREAYFRMRTLIQREGKGATLGESIDQSSSCASISLDGKDIQTHRTDGLTTDPPNRKPDTGRQILSRMRVAVVKWQTRKQFLEFTSDLLASRSSIHTWRRRRAVADALLSTGSKGKEWAALVQRRFTKTTERQIDGLRAILYLRDQEEASHFSSLPYESLKPVRPSCSYNLFKVIYLPSEQQPLLQDVIPQVLRSWPTDKPCAIVWLARVIPDFMSRVDGELMSRYGRQAIQKANPWTSVWLDGIWLLTALFFGQFSLTERLSTSHSVAKFVLHAGMEVFGKEASDAIGTTRGPSQAAVLSVLYPVVLICLRLGEGGSLQVIVPSTITLGPFVEACVDALCTNGSMTCAALKALALLRDVPTALEDIPPLKMSLLISCCMDIILVKEGWSKSSLIEKCGEVPFPLVPEEDAFDILCRLPQPAFPKALAAALAECPVCLDPSTQDHLKLFNMLEPLLWLSNIPPSIPEAHRALVDGDACEFLAKIVIDSPQETWSWQDRAIWRVKGEAITCLGNIIEEMDEKELRSHLAEDVIKAIANIRENDEAPLAQRDQGTFTLQRYKSVADRCGVVPFCKEILVHEPGGDSNGGDVWSVSNGSP